MGGGQVPVQALGQAQSVCGAAGEVQVDLGSSDTPAAWLLQDQELGVAAWPELLQTQLADAKPLVAGELHQSVHCVDRDALRDGTPTSDAENFGTFNHGDIDMAEFFSEQIVPGETENAKAQTLDDGWETDDSEIAETQWLPRNSRPVTLKTIVDSDPETFIASLRRWSIQHKVEHTKITALLNILKKYTHYQLPKSARTLLKVSSEKPKIIKSSSFEYVIFDISKQLTSALDNYIDIDSLPGLLLNINLDGISFFKSPKQAWPLLISCYNLKPTFVCMGLFSYGILPKDLSFMSPIFDQLNMIVESGLLYRGKKINVRVGAICCDAPARAKLRGSKQHNGFAVWVHY